MTDKTIEAEVKAVVAETPTLTWDQRDAISKHKELITAKTEYLKALKDVPPETLEAERKRQAPPQHWTDRFHLWATLWALLFMGWVWTLMTWRKDVFPR